MNNIIGMKCPDCNVKYLVKDVRYDTDDECMFDTIVYRRRQCPVCGRIVYTMECEIEEDESFMKAWRRNSRINKKHIRRFTSE